MFTVLDKFTAEYSLVLLSPLSPVCSVLNLNSSLFLFLALLQRNSFSSLPSSPILPLTREVKFVMIVQFVYRTAMPAVGHLLTVSFTHKSTAKQRTDLS